MTFNENDIVRDSAGRFDEKPQSDPEVRLGADDGGFRASPLSDADRDFGRLEHCGAVAYAVHERTGWPILALAVGDGWVHEAVQMPDGRVLDASGTSDGGQHILDDDVLYGLFEPEELALTDGEVELRELDPELAMDDRDRAVIGVARRIADDLLQWVES